MEVLGLDAQAVRELAAQRARAPCARDRLQRQPLRTGRGHTPICLQHCCYFDPASPPGARDRLQRQPLRMAGGTHQGCLPCSECVSTPIHMMHMARARACHQCWLSCREGTAHEAIIQIQVWVPQNKQNEALMSMHVAVLQQCMRGGRTQTAEAVCQRKGYDWDQQNRVWTGDAPPAS